MRTKESERPKERKKKKQEMEKQDAMSRAIRIGVFESNRKRH